MNTQDFTILNIDDDDAGRYATDRSFADRLIRRFFIGMSVRVTFRGQSSRAWIGANDQPIWPPQTLRVAARSGLTGASSAFQTSTCGTIRKTPEDPELWRSMSL